jgi:hypothetical protein
LYLSFGVGAAPMSAEITKTYLRQDPIFRQVFGYWRTKRARRPMPARRDIDPTEMGTTAIQHLVLTEPVIDDGVRRFRIRLAGAAIDRAAGRSMSGQYVDQVNPSPCYVDYLQGIYRTVMFACLPVISSSLAMGARRQAWLHTFRLMLPLSSDGTSVDMILAAQIFRSLDDRNPVLVTQACSCEPRRDGRSRRTGLAGRLIRQRPD